MAGGASVRGEHRFPARPDPRPSIDAGRSRDRCRSLSLALAPGRRETPPSDPSREVRQPPNERPTAHPPSLTATWRRPARPWRPPGHRREPSPVVRWREVDEAPLRWRARLRRTATGPVTTGSGCADGRRSPAPRLPRHGPCPADGSRAFREYPTEATICPRLARRPAVARPHPLPSPLATPSAEEAAGRTRPTGSRSTSRKANTSCSVRPWPLRDPTRPRSRSPRHRRGTSTVAARRGPYALPLRWGALSSDERRPWSRPALVTTGPSRARAPRALRATGSRHGPSAADTTRSVGGSPAASRTTRPPDPSSTVAISRPLPHRARPGTAANRRRPTALEKRTDRRTSRPSLTCRVSPGPAGDPTRSHWRSPRHHRRSVARTAGTRAPRRAKSSRKRAFAAGQWASVRPSR